MSFDASAKLRDMGKGNFLNFARAFDKFTELEKAAMVEEVRVRLAAVDNDVTRLKPFGAPLAEICGFDSHIREPSNPSSPEEQSRNPPPASGTPPVARTSPPALRSGMPLALTGVSETSTSSAPPPPPLSTPAVVSDANEVTDEEMSEMWKELDSVDVSSIDREAIKIFEYKGFNPNEIFKSLVRVKKAKGIANDVFLKDILTICALAVIKGSVNDNNFTKIDPAGQTEIARLESLYQIKRGSGRNEAPSRLTVSRIAAAFPGKIIQLISQDVVGGRKFIGPLKSHTLPSVMRHQAFAAVIPATLREGVKDFLLSLVTAFSVDQSLCINPNKKDKPDVMSVFESQRGFIQITADSPYPTEKVKAEIFKTIILNYEDLLICARAIQQLMPSFKIIDRNDFVSGINSA